MSERDAESGAGERSEESRPRIGVSSCLVGENVRWDRGHSRNHFLMNELDPFVEWVRVCPEVEAGFGVPRPTMRLVDREGEARLLIPSTGVDATEKLQGWAKGRVAELALAKLDGFILKKESPSCGLERVRVYGKSGVLHRRGRGLFAQALNDRLPDLPMEEDGRLNDPMLRDSFAQRVWCHHRWRMFRESGPTRAGLVAFHTSHKFLLRAHDEVGYRELGRVVAGFGASRDEEIFERYGSLFQETLRKRTSRGRHINVLEHLMGFFKHDLSAPEKEHLLARMEDYRDGVVPLIVPLSLLQFEAERRNKSYPQGQLYMEPLPKVLGLRNRI